MLVAWLLTGHAYVPFAKCDHEHTCARVLQTTQKKLAKPCFSMKTLLTRLGKVEKTPHVEKISGGRSWKQPPALARVFHVGVGDLENPIEPRGNDHHIQWGYQLRCLHLLRASKWPLPALRQSEMGRGTSKDGDVLTCIHVQRHFGP